MGIRQKELEGDCGQLHQDILAQRDLIIVSNRGPFSFQTGEDGEIKAQRSGGGLVTALLGLASQTPSTWIACAATPEDRQWGEGSIPLGDVSAGSIPITGGPAHPGSAELRVKFITPSEVAYEGYYGVISNPLLWFLQHSIWDMANQPNLDRTTWAAWLDGYVAVNRLFANAVVDQVRRNERPSLVMLQDYHLYLAPRMIRQQLRGRHDFLLTHFNHIPWPGPEDWHMLPARMREAILDGLAAVDLAGFQTREDALNFIRTCESLLPGGQVNYRRGRVMLRNHITHVRDFPISIDVQAVREASRSEETRQYYDQLVDSLGERRVILRIDRGDPSKNIVRGFQAFDEMLDSHPEYVGRVQFLALLVPSRMEVEEYQSYLNALMGAAGRVNARYGTSEWEPVRVLVGESYPRALAALRLYDVLLVNPVADGMNLVAKEGPTVNEKNGVLVLSERAGAVQQLGTHSLVIAPIDISATAEALNQALKMPEVQRAAWADALRKCVESEDIQLWLCWQLDMLQALEEAGQHGR